MKKIGFGSNLLLRHVFVTFLLRDRFPPPSQTACGHLSLNNKSKTHLDLPKNAFSSRLGK